jgi:hypothetical protein
MIKAHLHEEGMLIGGNIMVTIFLVKLVTVVIIITLVKVVIVMIIITLAKVHMVDITVRSAYLLRL